MNIVQPRLYSTRQLAEITGIPATSIALFVAQGLLLPSERRGIGRGHGHAWRSRDVASAKVLKLTHTAQVTALPLRALMDFLREPEGAAVLDDLWATRGRGKPRFLIATDLGSAHLVNEGLDPDLKECAVAYIVNLNRVIADLNVPDTEVVMRFAGPNPDTGRVPIGSGERDAARRPRPTKARRPKVPRLLLEAPDRQGGEKKKRKKRGGS